MTDLSTTYMGLPLKNPVVAASSTFTSTVEDISTLEQAGVGAIVLKSLFEEDITGETQVLAESASGSSYGTEADDYLSQYVSENRVDQYLRLISGARDAVSIPVIASINAHSSEKWIEFASRIEKAGAQALEINLFALPSGFDRDGTAMEKIYTDTVFKLLDTVSIPISLKLGWYFSSLAHTLEYLSGTGIKGMVLFNRFINPDIDIDTMTLGHMQPFSNPDDLGMTLRWIGILSNRARCDLAASTGIHDAPSLVKVLLAGARVGYVASTFYQNGMGQASAMIQGLEEWMKSKNFTSIDQFRGKLSMDATQDPALYERAQFIRHFTGHK